MEPLAETASAASTPVVDLTSGRGNKENVEDSSPFPKRTLGFDKPPGSKHPL